MFLIFLTLLNSFSYFQTPLLPQAMNGSNSAHSETSSPPLPADLETGLGKDGGFQNVDTKV